MLDKKTRLNETIRNQIVVNALKSSGCFAEGKQLVEDRAAFAVKVHALVLSNAGLTEEGLDKEWLRVSENDNDYIYSSDSKNSWMRVNLAGVTVDLCFNGAESSNYNTHLGDGWGGEIYAEMGSP